MDDHGTRAEHRRRERCTAVRLGVAVGAALLGAALFADATTPARAQSTSGPITVGFIVKTLTNPYFAAMQKAAEAKAKQTGVKLIFEAGKYDGDVSTQISDIEDLTTRGVKSIIIVPSVSAAVVPALRRAKAAGVTVIAVDTAVGPPNVADSFVATNNFKGGLENGEWAKAAMGGTKPVVALLEGTPASSVNTQRLNGFLKGIGMTKGEAAVDLITNGDQTKALTAMQNALVAKPGINLVWTINEPAGFGAYTAISKAGLAGKIRIVSMDGSCNGVHAVADHEFDTDVLQFPTKMADVAIDEAIDAAHGKKLPTRVDTGEPIVTLHSVSAVPSIAPAQALHECWG